MASRERKDSFVCHNHLSYAFGDESISPFMRLSRSGKEIRLFRLEPGRFRDQPQGSFEKFQVNKCPPYRAISYEWGDGDPVHPVTVGAATVYVRFNLHLFLKNFQALMDEHNVDLPYYIWVDHLCIDQQDDDERCHQVQLMHNIYWNATEVIAWLGPDHDQHSRYKRTTDENSCCSGVTCCVKLIGPRILNSSFFSRLWIQQEMVLARKVIFMVGRLMLSAARMLKCMKRDLRFLNHEPALQAALKTRSQKQDRYSLVEAIELFSNKICKEKRDKVYGLLGMVWDYQRIPVRYHNFRRFDLFETTVKAVFSHELRPIEEDRIEYIVDVMKDLAYELGVDRYLAHDTLQEM